MSSQHAPEAPVPDSSVRPVIEHALIGYGYTADAARTLLDRLIAEARAE